jgi:DSF synthase
MTPSIPSLSTSISAGNDNLSLLATPRLFSDPKIGGQALNWRTAEVELEEMSTYLEHEIGILWAEMKHERRACYTPQLVDEARWYQTFLKRRFAHLHASDFPFKFLVWRSNAPGVFSLGGDLNFFTSCIRHKDRQSLHAYAMRCIEVLYDNYNSLDMPIVTVALVRGDAIGGGLESMMTNDIVIAEKGAKFRLPEVHFSLFPGMGGYSFLVRKIGEREARVFVEEGKSKSAEEMRSLGLIDIVAEPGEGERALRKYINEIKSFENLRAMRQARRRVNPVSKKELVDIAEYWIDIAMNVNKDSLHRMDCLARVQLRKRQTSCFKAPQNQTETSEFASA